MQFGFLPSQLQTRHNNGPVLGHIPVRRVPLHEEINGKTQLRKRAGCGAAVCRAGCTPARIVRSIHRVRVIPYDSDIIAAAHEAALLARHARGIGLENFDHVFLCVGGDGGGGALAVGGDVERLVIVVEEFEDVGGWRGVDDRRRDDLVHCLVVGGAGGVVDEAGAAAVDGTGEEGHADAALLGDSLERADEICPFEVLRIGISSNRPC